MTSQGFLEQKEGRSGWEGKWTDSWPGEEPPPDPVRPRPQDLSRRNAPTQIPMMRNVKTLESFRSFPHSMTDENRLFLFPTDRILKQSVLGRPYRESVLGTSDFAFLHRIGLGWGKRTEPKKTLLGCVNIHFQSVRRFPHFSDVGHA